MDEEEKEDETGQATNRKRKRVECGTCIIHSDSAGPSTAASESFAFFFDIRDSEKTFQRIKQIRDMRLAEPIDSVNRMENVCSKVPSTLNDNDGYHRECYQRFTKNLDRLKATKGEDSTEKVRKSARLSADGQKDTVTLFAPDCIFPSCRKAGRKNIKTGGSNTTEGLTEFNFGGGSAVIEQARKLHDVEFISRIDGQDWFARSAKYHPSCRKKYMQQKDYWRSSDIEEKTKQQALEEAHSQAFMAVTDVVNDTVVRGKKMHTLKDLNEIYMNELDKTNFPNRNHRGTKLKERLEKSDLKDKIGFAQLGHSTFKSTYVVYSKSISVDEAVKTAYELGSSDKIREVAHYIRRFILDAYEKSEEMKWPPDPHTLLGTNIKDIIPGDVLKFISIVISDNPDVDKTSPRFYRLICSVAQDLCRAATGGKWKLPKHILICMTLRHMFRSAELTTMLNRIGHCESYTFTLQLECAIAESVEKASHLLTQQIERNPVYASVFHSEFDNFDQFVNMLTGSGIINTAHGIMLQEVYAPSKDSPNISSLPEVPRTSRRTLVFNQTDELPECFVNKRASPNLTIQQKHYSEGPTAVNESIRRTLLWILIRKGTEDDCVTGLPGWSGYVSLTGKTPSHLTRIDYYPVILHPITQYPTVQE